MGRRFVEYVRDRLHKQNRNYLCAIVGPTGSGKSYSALRLAEQVDPDFSIGQVCFTPKEFMDLLNSGRLKRGSVIVFDEAGVAVNSRNFQSQTNKLLHYVNQTFRSNNYGVIYTLPDFGFLDVGIRKLVHSILETKKIDYNQEVVWVRPLMVENNAQSGKIYMKYPRVRYAETPRLKKVITKMFVHKPSDRLIKDYETRKAAYNKGLQSDVQATLNTQDKPPQSREQQTRDELKAVYEKVLADKDRYLNASTGSINEGRVALDFMIGGRKIKRLKHLLLEAGHAHASKTLETNEKRKAKSRNRNVDGGAM